MRIFLSCCLLLIASTVFAQLNTCLNTTPGMIKNIATVPLSQTAMSLRSGLDQRSPYQPAMGVSQYVIDGQAHLVPAVGMQYVPQNKSAGKWIYSGGLMYTRGGSSGFAANPRFTNFANTSIISQTESYDTYSPSLALAYAGAQYRYYLLQGDIQPYVGAGAQTLGWRIDNRWGAAISPNAVAGVTARISTIFSGYAEVQHTLGMGNIYSSSSSFGGITALSFGFSFAPNFSRW